MSQQNVQVVQDIYAAFGRGDVQVILDRVTDDTEWGFNVGASDVPWHAPVKGKGEVPRFFEKLQAMEVHAFEPKAFMDSGPHVIAHIHIAYTVRSTGKEVDMDQLHWWTLNGESKVKRLMHFEDTAAVLAAHSH